MKAGLAFALTGTAKQFEIEWDGQANAIRLTTGLPYTPNGTEMTGRAIGIRYPRQTTSTIYLDGETVEFAAYNIDGSNYFRLRDIGRAFDFGVSWDGAARVIAIDTNIPYETANNSNAPVE